MSPIAPHYHTDMSVPDDAARLEEIQSTFRRSGYVLLGPDRLGEESWAAPFVPVESRGGSAPFGWGTTALEAAEDALRLLMAE